MQEGGQQVHGQRLQRELPACHAHGARAQGRRLVLVGPQRPHLPQHERLDDQHVGVLFVAEQAFDLGGLVHRVAYPLWRRQGRRARQHPLEQVGLRRQGAVARRPSGHEQLEL